jgi:hypothetical protein
MKHKETTLLYKLLQKKVGHISDNLWHEALAEAQSKVRANKIDSWSRSRKLVYIVNVMSEYIRIICKFEEVK